MIHINNLGYHTDCIARKHEGKFSVRDSYYVLRMPSNPIFHWGNLLVYKEAPKRGDFSQWISAFNQEFGEDIGHVTFGWESQKIGDISRFLKAGFSLVTESVLVLDKLQTKAQSKHDLIIRTIVSDDDWAQVFKLQVLISEGKNPTEAFLEFQTRSFESYRRLSESGDGNWWGAFSGDQLVADMGLYFDDELKTGRFQSVETHPDHRRKGICSLLLHAVASEALKMNPEVRLVICANEHSTAERIYQNLGFVRTQLQHGVCLPSPMTTEEKLRSS